MAEVEIEVEAEEEELGWGIVVTGMFEGCGIGIRLVCDIVRVIVIVL